MGGQLHPSLELCVQYSEDGKHIRKWSREPFEGGECLYAISPEAAARHRTDAIKPLVIGIAITAAATSAREKALQEAAELCRLPVPAASDVSADYLAGRYDAADEVRLAILSLIAPERDAAHA